MEEGTTAMKPPSYRLKSTETTEDTSSNSERMTHSERTAPPSTYAYDAMNETGKSLALIKISIKISIF